MTLKNQLCKICNQPDNYSEDCICSKCIKKWKEFHIEKGKSDERERILEIIENMINGVVYEKELSILNVLKNRLEEKK